MDNYQLRYTTMMGIRPVEVKPCVNIALPGPFTKKDWNGLPRKLKKKVKKEMLLLNKLLY